MADYVWSPIQTKDSKGEVKVINVGETVTAADVGGKDALQELKDVGAVRDVKYPKIENPYESPREANLRKMNEAIQEAADNAYSNIDFLSPSEMEPPVAPS